ncbi:MULTISPECIES: hypothetical protein [unclassified Rhodococcus (in: high G+C Gram-positive bacteria)]|uniref:hypothetical protein n=1 Tax=unclassified Rhodococcus (in: high G+C Gram-positive bacteria) TaxID=192944 RepID=UPI00211B6FFF|nr:MULTISPECIES: hypothetical protein [unclassified Rhodococcus (in: high G+C Gram-positive bacteria)]
MGDFDSHARPSFAAAVDVLGRNSREDHDDIEARKLPFPRDVVGGIVSVVGNSAIVRFRQHHHRMANASPGAAFVQQAVGPMQGRSTGHILPGGVWHLNCGPRLSSRRLDSVFTENPKSTLKLHLRAQQQYSSST